MHKVFQSSFHDISTSTRADVLDVVKPIEIDLSHKKKETKKRVLTETEHNRRIGDLNGI